MHTPCTRAHSRPQIAIATFVFVRKTTKNKKIFSGLSVLHEIPFPFPFLIYEFLCVRRVNYDAFKYTCALHTAQENWEAQNYEKRKKNRDEKSLFSFAKICAEFLAELVERAQ